MDEVGRGTTVEDGLAIAFATVHHLLSVNQCRTLFATHFHELADMLGYSDEHKGQVPYQGVSFFCTDVNETEVSGSHPTNKLTLNGHLRMVTFLTRTA